MTTDESSPVAVFINEFLPLETVGPGSVVVKRLYLESSHNSRKIPTKGDSRMST